MRQGGERRTNPSQTDGFNLSTAPVSAEALLGCGVGALQKKNEYEEG